MVNASPDIHKNCPLPPAPGVGPAAARNFCEQCGQPLPGALLGPGGRYRLEHVVGEGTFSHVWRASDLQDSGAPRAIKVLPFSDPRLSKDALAEIKTLQQVNHPRLPRLYEAFSESSGLLMMMVMEFVDGPTLRDEVASGRLMDPHGVTLLAAEIADALVHLGQCNIVHRDVHPKNIVLGGQRGATLIDLGISRPVDRQTQPTGVDGYRSPEADLGDPCTPYSDVYGLGGCMYFALTGEEPPPPGVPIVWSARAQPIPARLGDLIAWSRAYAPQDRPSAMILAAELQAFLVQLGQPGQVAPHPQPAWPPGPGLPPDLPPGPGPGAWPGWPGAGIHGGSAPDPPPDADPWPGWPAQPAPGPFGQGAGIVAIDRGRHRRHPIEETAAVTDALTRERVQALLADGVLSGLLSLLVGLPLAYVLTVPPLLPVGVVWLVYFLVGWAVWGATPGQRSQRLAVVDRETERPPTLIQSLIRAIGYLVSFGLLGLPFLLAIFGEERRSFADLLANTMVVSRR